MAARPELRLTIGALARLAGVHPETVRFYERIGLVPRPPRTPGSVRRYPEAALQRVRFIKRAQWLGFSLGEVSVLLALAQTRICGETRALGEVKLTLVRQKLEELLAVRAALEALLLQCAESRGPGCPLLDALFSNERPAPLAKAAQAGTSIGVLAGRQEGRGCCRICSKTHERS